MREVHVAALGPASRRPIDDWVLRLRAIGDCVMTWCVDVGVEKSSPEVGKRVANLSANAISHVSFAIKVDTLEARYESCGRDAFGLCSHVLVDCAYAW
jgi:hypothetical protein